MGRKVNAEKGKQGFQPTVKGINAPTPSGLATTATIAPNLEKETNYTHLHDAWLKARSAGPVTESRSEAAKLLEGADIIEEETLCNHQQYSVTVHEWSNGKFTVSLTHRHSDALDIANHDVWDQYPDQEHYETIIEEQGRRV